MYSNSSKVSSGILIAFSALLSYWANLNIIYKEDPSALTGLIYNLSEPMSASLSHRCTTLNAEQWPKLSLDNMVQ